MIIWMAEKLFYAAAPKILKILEEPPDKTLFILISEDPEQVISTIRSRTLLVKIPKIRMEELREYLKKNFNLGEKEAGIIARQSGGNLKLAINRLRQIEDEQVHFKTFRDWMRLCFAKDMIGLINFSSEIPKTGREKQKSLLLYGLRILQTSNALTYTDSQPLFQTDEENTFIKNISPFFQPDRLPEFADLFEKAIYHIERNAFAPVLFMDLSLQVMRLFHGGVKTVRS